MPGGVRPAGSATAVGRAKSGVARPDVLDRLRRQRLTCWSQWVEMMGFGCGPGPAGRCGRPWEQPCLRGTRKQLQRSIRRGCAALGEFPGRSSSSTSPSVTAGWPRCPADLARMWHATPCLQTVRLDVVMAPGLVPGARRGASVDLVRSVRVAPAWPERACLESTPGRPCQYVPAGPSPGRKWCSSHIRTDQSQGTNRIGSPAGSPGPEWAFVLPSDVTRRAMRPTSGRPPAILLP